jgi:hypothetical protein
MAFSDGLAVLIMLGLLAMPVAIIKGGAVFDGHAVAKPVDDRARIINLRANVNGPAIIIH